MNLDGLLICISEPGLVQAILANPIAARSHMDFVLASLSSLPIFVLQVRYIFLICKFNTINYRVHFNFRD